MSHGPQKALGCPLIDRWGAPLPLEDMYLGGSVFLLCAGPSLKALDLSKLQRPGIVTFGINNVSAWFPTDLWTFGDKPQKFHDRIWRNQRTLKMAPMPKLTDKRLRRKVDGQFEGVGKCALDFPRVVGVLRNSEFRIEHWLDEPTINWGNSRKHKNGLPTGHNTMLQAIRLCYYLGFRTVYLLGVDFAMNPASPYAFGEKASVGSVRGNAEHYERLAWYFTQLRPWFEAAGFEVLNCNPASLLRVFDFITYDDAVARAALPDEPVDLVGWYEGMEELDGED